jgi:hypothetical protein
MSALGRWRLFQEDLYHRGHRGTRGKADRFRSSSSSRAVNYLPYCTVRVTTSPCAVSPAAVAVTVICDVPSTVGAATVTKEDPGSPAAGVAVTVTVAGSGTTAGGVYSPVPPIVPFALPPLTAQVTLWLAVNCCSLSPLIISGGHELPGSSANKTTPVGGFTVTVIVVLPLPATPPQEISATNPSARKAPAKTPERRGLPRLFRLLRPIPTMLASATHATVKNGKALRCVFAWGWPAVRACVSCRVAARGMEANALRKALAAPRFGPTVVIVSVTAVVAAPAGIVGGLNAQLAPAPPVVVVNGGRPEHAKITSELNAAPAPGAAEKVRVECLRKRGGSLVDASMRYF